MSSRYLQLNQRDTWIKLILVGLCIALLLPRLASAQFGLFDDGVTLVNSRLYRAGDFQFDADRSSGRYRPVYWAYNFILAWAGKESPFVFYLGNLIILVATVLLIYAITRKITQSSLATSLASGFFLFSGPVIESFYTLSKSEPLQVLLLLAGTALILTRLPQPAKFVLAVVAFTLANLTKETGLVMIPITAGWLVLAFLDHRSPSPVLTRPSALVGLAAALAAGVLFFVGRSFFLSGGVNSGTYANNYAFDLPAVAVSLVRWSGWLLRDFPHLLVLGAAWLLLVLLRVKMNRPAVEIAAFIWMAGWLIVFLPWSFMVEYYMLPFTAGAGVFMGTILARLVFLATRQAGRGRLPAIAGIALIALLILTTLANNLTSLRIQLQVDQANQEMMHTLAGLDPDSRVVISNQEDSEYTKVIPFILNTLYDRPDLSVDLYQGGAIPVGSYTLLPVIENQPRLTVRLGLDETTQQAWNSSFLTALASQPGQQIQEISRSFRMTGVDLPRLFCGFIPRSEYCAGGGSLVETRTFHYGWVIGKAGQ